MADIHADIDALKAFQDALARFRYAALDVAHFGLRAAPRVPSPSESDSLLRVPAAASLDDDRALYRDTEWPNEQVEKFKPYSVTSLLAFAQTAFGGAA